MDASTITRRTLGLPSESTTGAPPGQILVPATPEHEGDQSGEIPIASESEEETHEAQDASIEGRRNARQARDREGTASETLPSSSPLRFSSADIPDGNGTDAYPSQAGPRGVGDQPGFEDGELREDSAPPSNQQRLIDRNARWFLPAAIAQQYAQFPPPPLRFPVPIDLKRNRDGSQDSEEIIRSARRPRHDEPYQEQASQRLPPISEMLANPWGGPDGPAFPGGLRYTAPQPPICSTPRSVSQQSLRSFRSTEPFFAHDSQANVSGQPPTPFSRANTVAPGLEHHQDVSRPSRTEVWPGLSGEGDDMRVDEEDDEEEAGALLRTPMHPRTTQRRAAVADLREVLTDPPSPAFMATLDVEEPARRGGYAPRPWDRAAAGAYSRRVAPAVGGFGPHDEYDDMEDFSPVPYTKAWQHQQETRRNEERMRGGGAGTTGLPSAAQGAVNHRVYGHPDMMAGSTRAPSRATSRDLPRTQARAFDLGMRAPATNASWRDELHANVQTGFNGRWREYEVLPTAVAQAPQDCNAPTLAENPHDPRWMVHFDDPERLVSGQSAKWQKTMWTDPTAVIFSAYNYRYTSNGIVNRHLENAATDIVKHVTGESQVKIVPPHPDPTRKLSARELPFTWGARGLTKDGADAMISARVASSQGVSIIIHQKRLSNPTYCLSLVGFLRPDAEVIKDAVREALEEPEMYARIVRMTDGCKSLRAIPREGRAAYILSTLDVRIADLGKGDFMANVFMEPPTDDMAEFRTWVEVLRSREYNNFLNGAGTARAIYYCGGCRGVDHDTMMCPFPEMPGWQGTRQGAPSHTAEILDTAMDAPTDKKGGPSRGGGARGGKQKGGRDWNSGASQRDKGGREASGRGDAWRTHTPAGRSQWSGSGLQQSQSQRNRYYAR